MQREAAVPSDRVADDMVVGRSIRDLLHPDDAVLHEPGLVLLASAGVPFSAEVRLTRGGGRSFWCSVRGDAIDQHDLSEGLMLHVSDITDQRAARKELEDRATRDPLTGLLNRSGFDAALRAHRARCERSGPSGAVLMIDLNNFKQVNDTHGHHVGDQVIVSVAHTLTGRLRSNDVVGRIGGDEFVVLLPNGGQHEADQVAADLTDSIASITIDANGTPVRPTASIGGATFHDERTCGHDVLIAADATRYRAKTRIDRQRL